MNDSSISPEFVAALSDLKTIGRYKIIRELGRGASGVVYLGMDPFIKRKVAVKISQPASHRALERFFVEAQSAGRLIHQNMVIIHDVGMHDRFSYITMEYVEGTTLEEYCCKDNILPVNKAIEIILGVCNALDYAHNQGIIHRDIKPSNIMLNKEGIPKIADFGIAQLTQQTSEMGVWGTPSYMSPEQLKEESIGNYSDMFSLGCVLYELLTGEQAFPGENNFTIMYKITSEEPAAITQLRPELPGILNDIIKKALAKDHTQRYQTCMDLAYDLRVALRGFSETFLNGKIKDAMDYVHHIRFFQNFTKEQVKELLQASTINKFPKGKIIVTEGEIDDTLYVILSGGVKIKKDNKDVASLGAGECFGEMAYICGQARSATAAAETECILIKISATLMDRSSKDIQLLFYKNFATTLIDRFSGQAPQKVEIEDRRLEENRRAADDNTLFDTERRSNQDRRSGIEHRQHKRFKVKEDAFAMVMSAHAKLEQIKDMSMDDIEQAVLEAQPAQMGQIVNISKGGLAFRYIDNQEVSKDLFNLDILFACDAFHLQDIPYKKISDLDTVGTSSIGIFKMKQQGVQFGKMMPGQISQLDYFIQNHAA
jgi:serine/threonine protein kinase